ncbi:NAD-binding protein [Rickenella mellea]|uniref:NAD-binding protein n=1 Tax=Rickenella mellea TaxID=50990 RepID=A0A4Y7PZ19_9AGAM|nr:NAD-binding protein [Rickenella mellea]
MAQKQTVIVFGATGRTGASVVNGLIDSHKFVSTNVVAGIRPASKDKPEVETLKSRGVEIRLVDLHAIDATIDHVLRGVDVVVSAADYTTIAAQKQLVDAAKKAGVKRFIPNDWATACVRGVRQFYDDKGVVQDYIREVGIGYTFIDVGLWHRFIFPAQIEGLKQYGDGNVKCAFTDLSDVGVFAARIIDDPRTLNHYVFVWGEEATQKDIFSIVEEAKGVKVEPTVVPISQFEEQLTTAKAQGGIPQIMNEYIYSFWVRGDNVISNAKKLEYGGALDARELYPDIKPRTLIDYARSFYSKSN